MAIGVDRIYLSMQDTDTGEYLTANVYTVEGVTNVDGSPRRLSIGQLVMALCLQRAAALEADIVDTTTSSCARRRVSRRFRKRPTPIQPTFSPNSSPRWTPTTPSASRR